MKEMQLNDIIIFIYPENPINFGPIELSGF